MSPEFAFALFAFAAGAVGAAERNPACQALSSAEAVLQLRGGTNEVRIDGRADICESGFEFWPDRRNGREGLLLLSPVELGLNAKSSVYRVSFASGLVQQIGELPVAAERTSPGHYSTIVQQAGSLFLETYVIGQTSIDKGDASLELVVDGWVCTDRGGAAFVRVIDPSRDCVRRLRASRTKPVCLAHSTGRNVIVALNQCKPLLDRWGQG